ncbi:MAG: hypothetical protein PHG12_09450, partial [Sphaerochaeta sp.]|nr:hypothetical protein [Sphaerochaeta sp.]
NKEIVAFCRLKEFNSRIRKKNLIKSNKKELQQDGTLIPRKKGVPQGGLCGSRHTPPNVE